MKRLQFALPITTVFLLSLAPQAAWSDSYWHEYVMPDGSAIDCSTISFGASGGSTECTRLTPDQRLKVKREYVKSLRKLTDCIDLMKAAEEAGHSSSYAEWAYYTCTGVGTKVNRGKNFEVTTYVISCDGTPSAQAPTPGWRRSLGDCPGLKDLVLSGNLNTRGQGSWSFR